ncbi:hypothetical protein JCM15548_1762 [Geofilum rubicundum JCM 15548]|uniref:Uncharacterized protein n=1 Tax=Geofilum rubicundum JCM 15548 TaxID=1236989 RepID=A0A0E9LST5_9BACT|nr:hypothetical protein JCM15548_1762 [Geofilum rubicundum JCM 15548]
MINRYQNFVEIIDKKKAPIFGRAITTGNKKKHQKMAQPFSKSSNATKVSDH